MRVDHKTRVNVIAYATVNEANTSAQHDSYWSAWALDPWPDPRVIPNNTGSIYVAPWHAQTQYLKADAESCQLNACWSNFGCVLGCRVC